MGLRKLLMGISLLIILLNSCTNYILEVKNIYINQKEMGIIFSSPKEFEKIREIRMYTKDDIKVFEIPFSSLEIVNNVIFISNELMLEMSDNYDFVSNQQYEIVIDLPGSFYIIDIFIGNPIKDRRINILSENRDISTISVIILKQDFLYY